MQLPTQIGERYIILARRWKWWIVGGALSLFTGVAVWFIPPVHVLAAREYHTLAIQMGVEPVPVSPTSKNNSESSIVDFGKNYERIKNLEADLKEKSTEIEKLSQAQSALQEQFQAALVELGKSNDLLEQQKKEWTSALRRVGISIPSTIEENIRPSSLSKTKEDFSGEVTLSSEKININTANLAQFDSLPGIGPSYAQKIIDYREQKGNFKKIEDIQNVRGIGESIFEKIKGLIVI